MKSRPILFTGEMVRAILDGRKTQSRRSVGRLAKIGPVTEFRRSDTPGYAWCARDRRLVWNDLRHEALMNLCPYGQPGDRLWVRERTRVFDFPGRNNLEVTYEADGLRAVVPWPDRIKEPGIGQCLSMGCYREASRITLEVTAVRVERLLEISEADAIAEGCNANPGSAPLPIVQFMDLWHRINGVDSWNANPWVWVIEFKRVAP